MICRKCGEQYDGKPGGIDLCHKCRSIYAYEGLPARVVEKKPVPSKVKKVTPKAASAEVDKE